MPVRVRHLADSEDCGQETLRFYETPAPSYNCTIGIVEILIQPVKLNSLR